MNPDNYGGVANAGPSQLDQQQVIRGNYPMAQGEAQAPTRLNIARPISIEQLNHGYVIVVGCQRFAVESKDALLHRLGSYLSDPNKVEEDWSTGKLKF